MPDQINEVEELRTRVLRLEETVSRLAPAPTLRQRFRAFRERRNERIKLGVVPDFDVNPCLVVHVATESALGFDPEEIPYVKLSDAGAIAEPIGWNRRPQLNNLSMFQPNPDGGARIAKAGGVPRSYVALSWSGVLEAAENVFVERRLPVQGDPTGGLGILGLVLESSLDSAAKGFVDTVRKLGAGSVLIGVSLLGVNDRILIGNPYIGKPFSSDDVILPEVILEAGQTFEVDVLRPVFERLWNVAGMVY